MKAKLSTYYSFLIFFTFPLAAFGQAYKWESFNDEAHKHLQMGKLPEAISFFDSSIKYCKIEQPERYDLWADLEFERGNSLLYTYNLEASEKYVNTILEEYRQGKREGTEWEAPFLLLKADILVIQRNFEGAIATIKKALPNLKKIGGTKFLPVAYSQIGNCYNGLKEVDSTCVYLSKSIELQDTNSILYMISLVNLASAYKSLKQCDSSIKYIKKAVEKSYLHPMPPASKGDFFSALSETAYQCGYYDMTLSYTEQAKANYIIQNRGANLFNRFLGYRAVASLKLGYVDSAYIACKEWIPMRQADIISESSFLSSDEKDMYINRKGSSLSIALSIIQQADNLYEAFNNQVYEYAVFLKNFPLRSLDRLQKTIKSTDDTSLIQSFNNWVTMRSNYYERLRFSNEGDAFSLDSLKQQIWLQEKNLYKNANLKQKHANVEYGYIDKIASKLKADELSIEFVRYYDVSQEGFVYGAFLTHHQSKYSTFMYICSEDTITSVLQRQPFESEFKYIKRLYGNNQLYSLIWSKIVADYPNKNKFYTSYSGVLNKISHEALKIDDDRYLFDKIRLTVLNSTVQLLDENSLGFTLNNINAFLFGGIKYDLDSTVTTKYKTNEKNVHQLYRSQIEGNWEFLKYTVNEIEGVSSIITSNGGKVSLFRGINASESSLKAAVENQEVDILHIATHGFYLNDTTNASITLQTSTYTRSGLVMAGANTCHSQQSSIKGFGDGIITAPEVSAFNLQNTKLVVLSACESGLGKIDKIGDIYGLQRAFKIAGVDYVLYSLWKVSDEATNEFMQNFYKSLVAEHNIETAFYLTKKAMQKKYSAFYWAPFQLIR
jgi:CHAT domain-containing protein